MTDLPPGAPEAATLLLFDIDGTLLRGGNHAHWDALIGALTAVHGIEPGDLYLRVSPAGRTDGEIARAILLDAGVPARLIDERAEAVALESCRMYAELCPDDLTGFVTEGIPELLEWLGHRHDMTLSLVTGNFEPIARLKLLRAGLSGWFRRDQGGFGSDSEDRAALPPIARARAGQNGVPFPRERTIVIGDTPRDIACARADGLRCFAVTSGPFTAAELVDADTVAADARELRGALGRV
ncbi:MAG: HAD family hydrolase [Solirubrobacteraceae bacterium]